MRLSVVVLALASIVLGAMFGALNAERVEFDFYLIQLALPKGAVLLAVLLLGWLLGGLVVWIAQVGRLRRELRIARRELRQLRARAPDNAAIAAVEANPTAPA